MNCTKPYGDLEKSKVLVIGHDPRLIYSETIAEYCFFADYYMEKYKGTKPTSISEKNKYNLARSNYLYINNLTNYKYKNEEIYITNLCNNGLVRSTSGTVYIPESEAEKGVAEIKEILNNSKIEKVFAQSAQVNYWLQKLGIYSSNDDYVKLSEPVESYSEQGEYMPYYRVKKLPSPFYSICGKEYMIGDKVKLYPIIHVKQYNNGDCGVYKKKIELCKSLNS